MFHGPSAASNNSPRPQDSQCPSADHSTALRLVLLAGMILALATMALRASAAAVQSDASPGVLVTHGTAAATIVIPAQPNPAETYAAQDLQAFVRQTSGATLPIVADDTPVEGNRILVGNTRWTVGVVPSDERKTLSAEGYVVRLRGRDLALAGGGPYGTIYAAAELYDRLGARWYLPGELGACLPNLESIRFDTLDVRREPSFAMRWVGSDTAWNLRNRTNRIEDESFPPAFVVYPGIYHTQARLLPDEVYGESHPEFFALVDGKRSQAAGVRKLCNSNPLLPDEIARNMATMLREQPGIDLISLSPTDGQAWCECEACRALDDDSVAPGAGPVPSDQRYSRRQMILYNRVAEALRKDFPDQLILVGAYNTYTLPPRDPNVRAHPNLAVVICHYQPTAACLAHPVNDPDCKPNARYLDLIRAWQGHTPHVYFYEYYYKVNWLDLPWPIVHTVAADIPFYKSIGVEGLYTQYSTGVIWGNFLPMYVAARLLWDHTTDVGALLDEFYPKFYGKAAGPMRRWHETLEQRMAASRTHIAGGAAGGAPAVFTRRVMNDLKASLAEAQTLAADDLVRRRLEKIALLTEYTDKLAEAFRLTASANTQKQPDKRLQTIEEAYLIADPLRDDLLAHPKRYEGVADGRYFRDNLYMHRILFRWRKELVDAGVLDPKEFPDKGGGGRRH